MNITRKNFLALGGAVTALSILPATASQATTARYQDLKRVDETIGSIEAPIDFNSGFVAGMGGGRNGALAVMYSMGIAPRLHVVSLETGKVVATENAYTERYDRAESRMYYSNRQFVTLTAEGLLIHTNGNDLKSVCYKPSNRNGRPSPRGQLSTIAVGSSAWEDSTNRGLDKSYVGDFDGRLGRFLLPVTQGLAATTDPWYSFGTPFGQHVDIRSTAFIGGHLYVGVNGQSDSGIYRISEKTLDEAVAQNKALTKEQFTKLDLGLTLADKDQLFIHLTTYSTGGRNYVGAYIRGGMYRRYDVTDLGVKPPVFGSDIAINQHCQIEEGYLYTRYRIAEANFALIRYKLTDAKPAMEYLSAGQKGSLFPGSSSVRVAGRKSLTTFWGQGLNVVPIDQVKANHSEFSAPKSIETGFVPASRTQINQIAFGSAGSWDFLAFAPTWVNDYSIGVIKNPMSVPGGVNSAYIRQQSSMGRVNHDSNQVESMGVSRGQLTIGTYPNGGAQVMSVYEYEGDKMTSDKLVGIQLGDRTSSRYASQARIGLNTVVYGVIGKFNEVAGGLAVYRSTSSTPGARQSLTTYTHDKVLPNQNITAVANTSLGLMIGGSVRLESSATSQLIDPSHDATMALIPVTNGGIGITGKKVITLFPGTKVVWSILELKNGRIFAIVQYGADVKMKYTHTDNKEHVDVNALIEIDRNTLKPIPSGPEGLGTFIYPTHRRYYKANCQLFEAPNGQLVARTNVQTHIIDVAGAGQTSAVQLSPVQAVNIALGSDGTWYTTNYDGFVHRIRWT